MLPLGGNGYTEYSYIYSVTLHEKLKLLKTKDHDVSHDAFGIFFKEKFDHFCVKHFSTNLVLLFSVLHQFSKYYFSAMASSSMAFL